MKLLVSLLKPCGLALLLAAAGCARPEAVPQPEHLLSRDLMTSLLIRTHLLEARMEASRLAPDSARALFQSQQRDILWHYNVTEADSSFQRSFRYYATHDKDLEEIYTVVIDSLVERDKALGGAALTHPY